VTQHPRPTSPAPDRATVRRWQRRLADERLEADVYRGIASRRSGEERAILLELAEAEARHASHWAQLLGPAAADRRRPSLRASLLALLARRFGSVFVLALAQRAESRSPYQDDADATRTMAADELVHAEVVRGLAERGRAQISGTFRAAVFGANDGLVSNLALVLGVAGGGAGQTVVLLTGLAGLLSGALSMGAGEYLSVRSQRELLAASTPGSGHVAAYPHLDVDANELALVYRARGMPIEQARAKADAQLRAWPVVEQDDYQDGGDVVGSGLGAAASSFLFFACGATVPVLPFLLGLSGGPPCWWPACWWASRCWARAPRSACCRAARRCGAGCASWRSAPARRGSPSPSAACSARRSAERGPGGLSVGRPPDGFAGPRNRREASGRGAPGPRLTGGPAVRFGSPYLRLGACTRRTVVRARRARTVLVCHCHRVNDARVDEVLSAGASGVRGVVRATRAGTGCGGCIPLLRELCARAEAPACEVHGTPRRSRARFGACAATSGSSRSSTRSSPTS
jgi:VIT1/CCC1 family predicted Fe2+/Mn2+ transporter/bacterioferritin-associated ferredoxin